MAKQAQKNVVEMNPLVAAGTSLTINPKWKFTVDYRKANPELHLHHTELAIEHMVAIGKSIETFKAFNTPDLDGVVAALVREREVLIKTDVAYAQAMIMLDLVIGGSYESRNTYNYLIAYPSTPEVEF